jgi:hypothetical protein
MFLALLKRTCSQRGSALLYVLFISVVFGIVLSFILAAVTFGQRNIIRYELKQQAEYRTEGAFEIALKLMENYVDETDENKTGIFYFLTHELAGHDPQTPFFVFTIGGVEVKVGLELIENNGETVVARMFDLDRPHLKRTIQVTQDAEDSDDEVPDFDDGYPEFDPQDGTIFTVCGTEIRIVSREELMDGNFAASCRLVITSAADLIHVHNREVYFDADQGIYLGTDLSSSAYKDITLRTANGDLFIGEGAVLDSSRNLLLKADQGHIVSENASYYSRSYSDITLQAGKYVSLVDVTLASSRNIVLHAKNIYLENVTLVTSSNGTIQLNGEQSVTIKNSVLRSSNLIDLSSGGAMSVQNTELVSQSYAPIELRSVKEMNISGAKLQSSNYIELASGGNLYAQGAKLSTSSWTDIRLLAAGDISVQNAALNASRDLLMTLGSSEQTLDVAGAELRDRDLQAQVEPRGVQMVGKPAYGCADNGIVRICP